MGGRSRASIRSYFTLPYDVEELFSEMHGSIDPDSGHIICHKYTPRLGVINNGESSIPYIVYSNCVGIVVGDRVVGKLLSMLDAKQVEYLEVRQSVGLVIKTNSGEISVENLILALHRLRILGYGVTKIYLGEVDGKPIPILVGVDKENRREMMAVFVEPECSVQEAKPSIHI